MHHDSIEAADPKSLREGQKVTMEVTQGAKGPQAERVVPG
ncbi:cold-shock protein [Streptomyces actinomycinicus]|nr:cold shock domain-containing protein [Streptomyces actinomycinicus]